MLEQIQEIPQVLIPLCLSGLLRMTFVMGEISRGGSWHRTQSSLRLPAFRTVINKCLCYDYYSSPNKLKQSSTWCSDINRVFIRRLCIKECVLFDSTCVKFRKRRKLCRVLRIKTHLSWGTLSRVLRIKTHLSWGTLSRVLRIKAHLSWGTLSRVLRIKTHLSWGTLTQKEEDKLDVVLVFYLV